MVRTHHLRLRTLGEAEQDVMDYIWSHGPASAEACREALHAQRPMKESTTRTILTRLEEKGYVTHVTEGRTYIYQAADARSHVAVRAVRHLIDRFCNGSAEELVIGMVKHEVLDAKQLERLLKAIAQRKGKKG
jgi:BlaI family transcriptional regulator, penicillinase repressor